MGIGLYSRLSTLYQGFVTLFTVIGVGFGAYIALFICAFAPVGVG